MSYSCIKASYLFVVSFSAARARSLSDIAMSLASLRLLFSRSYISFVEDFSLSISALVLVLITSISSRNLVSYSVLCWSLQYIKNICYIKSWYFAIYQWFYFLNITLTTIKHTVLLQLTTIPRKLLVKYGDTGAIHSESLLVYLRFLCCKLLTEARWFPEMSTQC